MSLVEACATGDRAESRACQRGGEQRQEEVWEINVIFLNDKEMQGGNVGMVYGGAGGKDR